MPSPHKFISPLANRRISGGSSVYSDTTALHEWHYLNATEVGTTVTYPDTGIIGGLPLANIDVASKPTIGVNGIIYNGIANNVQKSVANFRPLDTTGEVVMVYKLVSGVLAYGLVVQNSTLLIEHFLVSSIVSNTIRFDANPTDSAPRRTMRGSTNVNNTTTFYTVTWGNTGSSYYIIVSGNNETITMITGANDGATWTNDFNFNLITIGALFRTGAANIFSNIQHKYSSYRPYTSIAESVAKNVEINTNVNV